MDNESIYQFIDALYVAGLSRLELDRINYEHHGHIVMPIEKLGFVGGNLTQMAPDKFGRIRFKNLVVSPLLGCGHVTTSIKQIGGTCHVCKRLICIQCLRACDLTGVTVCRKHSIIKDGVVISFHAKKGLWRLKAYNAAKKKKELNSNGRKQIPKSTT